MKITKRLLLTLCTGVTACAAPPAGPDLLPLSTIRPASAAQIIPNKDQAVLVYCHSGRRSRKACLLLSKLGYTHICDLGGILDWPYEKE